MHTPAGFQPVCSGSSGDVQTVHIICILASPTRLSMTERQQDVVCVVFEIVYFLSIGTRLKVVTARQQQYIITLPPQ